MRRSVLTAVCVTALTLAACGDDDTSDGTGVGTATTTVGDSGPATTTAGTAPDDAAATTQPSATTAPAADAAACAEGKTLDDGVLTLATSDPAFPPYVIDNAPESGQGFEAAVAMAVADQMGFTGDDITWVRTTFDQAIQPGAKNFDLNIQQYSITPRRARNVTFSAPYFTSNQALVGLEGSAAVGATTIADLKGLKLGAQTNTTSLEFITEVIQPDTEPSVYNDNVAVKAALEADQIDAVVFDLPTAFFVTAVEIEGSQVIGQFPLEAGGRTDDFGIVLENDNPLVECVDIALATLRESGELDAITEQWMSENADVPVISAN
jgi:polar amino acid transport system substrate-binding protein